MNIILSVSPTLDPGEHSILFPYNYNSNIHVFSQWPIKERVVMWSAVIINRFRVSSSRIAFSTVSHPSLIKVQSWTSNSTLFRGDAVGRLWKERSLKPTFRETKLPTYMLIFILINWFERQPGFDGSWEFHGSLSILEPPWNREGQTSGNVLGVNVNFIHF